MRAFKIYSRSYFQIYNTVLLTTVIVSGTIVFHILTHLIVPKVLWVDTIIIHNLSLRNLKQSKQINM